MYIDKEMGKREEWRREEDRQRQRQRETHVTQVIPDLVILLPQASKYWDYSHVPSHPHLCMCFVCGCVYMHVCVGQRLVLSVLLLLYLISCDKVTELGAHHFSKSR